jgi:membrane protease YdiL (CAAX protease family)
VIVLGRIWPAILAHAIFNAVALAVALTGVLDGVS